MTDSEKGKPSPYLLAIVFEGLNFSHQMGLYFLHLKDKYRLMAGSFHMFPIIKDNEIGAFAFHIRGIDFLLNLFPGHAPPALRNLGINLVIENYDYVLDAEPIYRSTSLLITNEDNKQQSIYFKW